MSIRRWRVVAFGMFFVIAVVQLGCRFENAIFGAVETPASQGVHPGGNGWEVQVLDDDNLGLAAVMHRSVSEFMVAPVQLHPNASYWWQVSAFHEFESAGLHRVSFHVRSADTRPVTVKFAVETRDGLEYDNGWLLYDELTADEEGYEVGAAFHYDGPVRLYFFPLTADVPFIIRDFTVSDVKVQVVPEHAVQAHRAREEE